MNIYSLLGYTGYTQVVEAQALPPCVGTANGFAMPPVVIIHSIARCEQPKDKEKKE